MASDGIVTVTPGMRLSDLVEGLLGLYEEFGNREVDIHTEWPTTESVDIAVRNS